MKRYYCTYFDKKYIIKGIALIESLIKHEKKEFELFVICLDEITRVILKKFDFLNVNLVPLHLIESKDLDLIKARSNRSLIEYYWTLTPTIIFKIIKQNPHIDILTYLDADLFFYSSPDPIWKELGNHSVMIHEHRFSPEQAHMVKYGKYNVGLLCFRNNENGLKVLNWWRENCNKWCYARLENGKYGDQLYLNDWTERFEDVYVLKNIGAGVGPWNHIQYSFYQDINGNVMVNNTLLIFYHFHSITFIEPEIIIPSKYVPNPFTEDIIRFCFIPYVNHLQNIIKRVKLILPDFYFGLIDRDVLTQEHTFIATKDKAHFLKNNTIIQKKISIDNIWDCYCSAQFRIKENKQSAYEQTLPVPRGMKQNPPDLILDHAEAELNKGNITVAIQILLKITEKWPNYYLAYNDLGVILWKEGKKNEALACLEKAIEINPFDKKIVLNISSMLKNLKKYSRASIIINKYLEKNSSDTEIRNIFNTLPKPVMINLGCGQSYHKDWINIDIDSRYSHAQHHNLYKGVPFSDSCVDIVYHSHVLEHMPKTFAPIFIKECKRVLKPGGIIRIAVPDLEQIIRLYIENLENSLKGDNIAKHRYDWIMLELFDQFSRNQSGGAMLEYWKKLPVEIENFVFNRCGRNLKNDIHKLSKIPKFTDLFLQANLVQNEKNIQQFALFRLFGENHLWMYDRYSLSKLLEETGFINIKKCEANESDIPNFKYFYLEKDQEDIEIRPDSFYMEANKPL